MAQADRTGAAEAVSSARGQAVRLYSATEEHQVRLREIHTADASRVRHRRVCEAEDREIPYEEVGRG